MVFSRSGRWQICASFDQTLVIAHREFSANPWPVLIDRTAHGVPVQRRTPAIVQSRHGHPAPVIDFNKTFRHAGIANQHHFQTTTTGLAVCAAHFGCGRMAYFVWHRFSFHNESASRLQASCNAARLASASPPLMSGMMCNSSTLTAGSSTCRSSVSVVVPRGLKFHCWRRIS